jgi:hypothetical protein
MFILKGNFVSYTISQAPKKTQALYLPHIQNKNEYACSLVALTLINDLIENSVNNGTSVATNILFGTSYNLSHVSPLDNTLPLLDMYIKSLKNFTLSISYSTEASNYLLSREAFGLTTSGGRHKTMKRRRYRLKKKHMKTQHKRK